MQVIDRCLMADPEQRYPTGEALADALQQALEQGRETIVATPDRVIPTGQAEAIWLRAAQLQADAATRLEQRSRSGTGLTSLTQGISGGYRLRDVEYRWANRNGLKKSLEELELLLAEVEANLRSQQLFGGLPAFPAAPPAGRE